MTKQILIVGPAWVGDMVMAQSLFKLLKEQDVVIDVLAPKATLPLLSRMPEVRHSIAVPIAHGELQLKTRWQLSKQLRRTAYAQAILLTNTLKSALIPFFAGIPLRTGWRGEMRYGLLNDIRMLNRQQLPLMIERFCALALPKNAVLPPQLPWPALGIQESARANTLAKFNLTLNKPVLALCPGAEYGPAKRWPSQHYAAVANAKIAQGWQVWLLGSVNDQNVTQQIQLQTNHACLDFAAKTSLLEAIDLLSLATAVITNDSGLMHIAAALQQPTVAIYGSSDPRFTPPLNQAVKIMSLHLDCSPCFQRTCPLQHLRCLQDLAPDTVLSALDELLVC